MRCMNYRRDAPDLYTCRWESGWRCSEEMVTSTGWMRYCGYDLRSTLEGSSPLAAACCKDPGIVCAA